MDMQHKWADYFEIIRGYLIYEERKWSALRDWYIIKAKFTNYTESNEMCCAGVWIYDRQSLMVQKQKILEGDKLSYKWSNILDDFATAFIGKYVGNTFYCVHLFQEECKDNFSNNLGADYSKSAKLSSFNTYISDTFREPFIAFC